MADTNATDRRLGLVAGFLAGDALGAPFRAVKGGHIKQLAGAWVEGFLPANTVLFPDRPEKNTLIGLHSIHGQEFMAVLASAAEDGSGRSAVARGAAQLRELAGEAAEDEHAVVGGLRMPGRPLRRAVERWRADFPWEAEEHFALTEATEGASPAARGIASVLAGGEAIEWARLTHTKEAPLMAAWVIAETARLLMECRNPKRIDAAGLLAELRRNAREAESALREGEVAALWKEAEFGFAPRRFTECLAPLASMLAMGDDAVAEKTILAEAREHSPAADVIHVQHGFAAALIPWVLYRALGPMSPVAAVEDAVNRGGETPLAAALIGGLMGARYGIGHLNEDWLAGCLGWPIGKSMATGATPAAVDAWLAAERLWTGREEAMREPLRRDAEKQRSEEPAKKKAKPAESNASPTMNAQGKLPFAPPPQVWLEEMGDELAPWEKQRLKAERGRRRIEWKENRRELHRQGGEPGDGVDTPE